AVYDEVGAFNAESLKARQQLALLEAQRQDLGQYLRPKHPKMIALLEEQARCERLLEILSRQSVSQLESRRASLRKQIEGLEEEIEAWNRKSMATSQKANEYQRLRDSEQKVRSLYDRLLATLQTLDVNKEISPESVTVLEPATPPFSDLRKPARQLITGLVVGLALGVGLVFLIDHVDDRLNSHAELQEWFEESVLVQIPHQERAGRNRNVALLEANDSRHAFAEAYRSLRSSLLYLAREKVCPKTLLLTSSIPGEGKSITSANLAITLAQADARVLLMDGDLRKGDLHTRFGLTASRGLADVFQQRCRWEEAVLPTRHPNLALLGCGNVSNASSDLFVRQPMREFLQEIGADYDYIIVDAPPVMAADDVRSLAPQADGVLFVLRAGYTSARIATAALDVLYRRQVHVLGIVFNAVRPSTQDCYSYERYGEYFHRREASRHPINGLADET
ncbi:MAG TPA: polysaccharide biosynthesis tyrosine autokinase, partial [Candidatus Limnocylindrales bacterium]|nr:polysaccharide biosynthesis tyrosine autokinase [Candidatus Limnocylindrales bacterium]